MKRLGKFFRKHPKLTAALGTALAAGASAYAPGSGPVVRDALLALFGIGG